MVTLYLDANAGVPLPPRVVHAIRSLIADGDASSSLANPSSLHFHGRAAKRHLSRARQSVASSLGGIGEGVEPAHVSFCSSGTEANQWCVRSVLEPLLARGTRPHWITTPVEHESVLSMRDWLEARGGSVSLLPLDANGAPLASGLEELIRPETSLVSCLWVNNETGIISDIHSMTRIVRKHGIPIHIDGAQAWGKLPVRLALREADAAPDWVAFSGHKIGALAGTGAVWAREARGLQAVWPGHQENGARGGTENLMGAVSLGAAAEGLAPLEWARSVAESRLALERGLREAFGTGVVINGAAGARVANTLSLSPSPELVASWGSGRRDAVAALDLDGFSVSAGAACASGIARPSHVLLAMGRSEAQARSSLRISLVDALDPSEVSRVVGAISRAWARVGAIGHGGPRG